MQTRTKPLLVFGTRHGTIFNLTPSHLPKIPGIQLSVGDFYDSKQTLNAFPEQMTLKSFLGFDQKTVSYLSPYDFYKKEGMTGCDKNSVVKIKCNKGYTPFTAQDYDQIARMIKPDYLVTLTQYPASQKGHLQNSNKSHKRAINKTINYLQKTQKPKEPTKLLAAIHGGTNLDLSNRSLELVLEHQTKIDGLVLCDMCDGETIEQREKVYNNMLGRLKQTEKKDFVLGLAGLGKIPDIQHALSFGFNIFEVNYPFLLAQQHKGLVRQQDGSFKQVQPVLSTQLKPLDVKCKCYACSRHSQSYIAHLIACHELNAKILLSIHNLQMYLDYLGTFQ